MKRYKYIGTQEQADEYREINPIVDNIYSMEDSVGGSIVAWWVNETTGYEWEEVIEVQDDDKINPDHYKQGKVECIDALESATVNKTGIEAVCTANIIKYLWRYESKNGIEDCKKANWYLQKLINHLNDKENA